MGLGGVTHPHLPFFNEKSYNQIMAFLACAFAFVARTQTLTMLGLNTFFKV